MWLELHDTMLDHRKVRRLSRDMGLPSVVVRGHLVTLWLNVLRHAPDGNLADWDAGDIADYAEWTGEPKTLVDALISCKWLVDRHDHVAVNDWDQYAGHLIASKRKAADRLRKQAERQVSKETERAPLSLDKRALSESVQGRPRTEPEIRVDLTGPDRTGPDLTRPDLTGPDQNTLSSSLRDHDIAVGVPRPEIEQGNPARADEVREVFALYRAHHPRAHPKPQPKSKEWGLVLARLREGYSVEDLGKAIDGIHLSPFHCGENDRGAKYQGLKLALRDSDQVAKLIGITEQYANGPPPVLTEMTTRNLRAAVSWAERGNQDAGP